MTTHDAIEQAYKNGYCKAVEDFVDKFYATLSYINCASCPCDVNECDSDKLCVGIIKAYLLKEVE